jgi:hypothetical protein
MKHLKNLLGEDLYELAKVLILILAIVLTFKLFNIALNHIDKI